MNGLVVTHSYLQWEIIWFALVTHIRYCLKIMENVNNSGYILNEDHSPSFFQHSCTGNKSEEEKTVGEIPENVARVNEYINARPSKVQGEIGWVETLKCFPMLTNEILDNHLINGSSTVGIVSTGPKAFRNKKQGYRLWKEG